MDLNPKHRKFNFWLKPMQWTEEYISGLAMKPGNEMIWSKKWCMFTKRVNIFITRP